MKFKKKKFLILENFTHYRNCAETYKLLSKKYNVEVLIPKDSLKHLIFFKIYNLKTYRFSNYFIYIYLLFISNKYDYIIISNPPEYPDKIKNLRNLFSFLTNFLTFLMFCLIFKNKIILQIRNIKSFFPEINNNSLLSHLRYILIVLIKRFTLETKTISKEFKKLIISNNLKNKLFTYIYINHHYHKKKPEYSKSKIGILGTVDDKRKNYEVLFNGLSKLNNKNIELIFLGKVISFNKSKYTSLTIRTFKDFLPFSKFLKIGSSCKFLVSNLINKKVYGKFKSSGTFGDAIFLNKPLVVPAFSDPSKEFRDFCFYYTNNKTFTKLIGSLLKKKINYNFKKFTNEQHLKRLTKDLKL